MDNAAKQGDFDSLLLFREHYFSVGCTMEAAVGACLGSHGDIFHDYWKRTQR